MDPLHHVLWLHDGQKLLWKLPHQLGKICDGALDAQAKRQQEQQRQHAPGLAAELGHQMVAFNTGVHMLQQVLWQVYQMMDIKNQPNTFLDSELVTMKQEGPASC